MKNTKRISPATIVTNQILDQLKEGTVSWHKEWNGVLAYNYVTGKAYSTLNQLSLKGGAYLTFNQVKTLGGKVKKGAKSATVCFFTFFDKTENVEMTNLKTGETEKKEMVKTKSCLKYYRVFHQSSIEGIEFKEKKITLYDNSEIKDAQVVVDNYLNESGISLDISFGSNRAYYNSSSDEIVMPNMAQFPSSEAYYGTLFHEMTHSTGHVSRLGRNITSKFGSKNYAKEELVAEIGSAILNSMVGIDTQALFANNVAYINNWISALENDHNLIIYAACKAEKAVNLILAEDKINSLVA